jgi:hypothetical protein
MSSASSSSAILAAAGSRKTEYIVDSALAVSDGRVLVTTYTNENQRQIVQRIEQKAGSMPPHISVVGWFSFLIAQCARPYQRARVGKSLLINGLNFTGSRNRFARKSENRFFLDGNNDLYRDGVSDFVVTVNGDTNGAIIRRLENIYTHIFVDEVQDLVGYDLDVLDMLMTSRIRLTLVGDPRQHTLSTNIGPRNKKYRGAGIKGWFEERAGACQLQTRNTSYRCNQTICDFADAIYPHMPRTRSSGVDETGHDGIFYISPKRVSEYLGEYRNVTILRHDKRANTLGLPAMNIGVSKGSTFDRVMIFPTTPMVDYLKKRDPTTLKAPERLYVAVTRARFSVAFVVDDLADLGTKAVAGSGW